MSQVKIVNCCRCGKRSDRGMIQLCRACSGTQEVSIWDVTLLGGDWYYVFATSRREALGVVFGTHYSESLSYKEFVKEFKPKVGRVPNEEKILVNDEDRGQKNWTAKKWAKGEKPGPFTSNTYET